MDTTRENVEAYIRDSAELGWEDHEAGKLLGALLAERDALRVLCVHYRIALEKIAAYNDIAAWKQQRQHNSYAHFDEPGSVEIAHETLTRARSILS